MSSGHDGERHQEWRRNRASISEEGRGDERMRNRLPSPTNLLDSSTRQNLHAEPQSPTQVNRARNYFGPTCPSYNKLDPLTSNEMSSRALLSKFLSQPDDDSRSGNWSDRYGSAAESSRSGSHPSFQNSSQRQRPNSSSWGSRDIGKQMHFGQGSHEQERRRDEVHGSRDALETSMSRLQHSDIHSHDEGNNQASSSQGTSAGAADIHPIRLVNRYGEEEFRCPDCNRRCKSESSFERHKLSCTHRMGPLKLECKYCKRPYTYVGYLAKHETECEKMHPAAQLYRSR